MKARETVPRMHSGLSSAFESRLLSSPPVVVSWLPPPFCQRLSSASFSLPFCLLPYAFWSEPPSSLPHCGLPLALLAFEQR
jgi:hypothetical protein